MSIETSQKMSEIRRGKPSPLRGRTLSDEQKQKISNSLNDYLHAKIPISGTQDENSHH